MPFVPRLAWQVIRVYLPVRAQCTQCSFPATRSPVSSNPATSACGDAVADLGQEPVQPVRGAGGHRATVPSETGVPNSSANAAAVRFLDRNCPT